MTPQELLTLPSRNFDLGAPAQKVLRLPAPFVIAPALLIATSQQPAERSIQISIGEVRLERNRLVIARQRLVEALKFVKGEASVVEGVSVVWLKRNRLVIARQ